MAFKDSSTSVFKLDDSGGTLRTLTAYVDSVDGLPGARELSDVTALSDSGHKYLPTIPNPNFSINGSFDSTATTGPDAIIGGLETATATASFEYHPEGTGSGSPKYTGECWLLEYRITSQVGSNVKYSASFQVDGVVTRGTN